MDETISVRISKAKYKYIREQCKKNGTSVTWVVNLAIDYLYQKDPNYLRPAAARRTEKGKP